MPDHSIATACQETALVEHNKKEKDQTKPILFLKLSEVFFFFFHPTPHSPCLTTVVQQHVRKPHLLNTTRTQKINRNQYTLCLSLHKLEMVSLKPMMQTSSNPPSHTTLTVIWTQCWQGAFLRAPVSLMKDHHTVILHLMQRGIKEKKCKNPPLYTFLDHVLQVHRSQSVNLSSQTGDSESETHVAETTSIPLSHTTLTLIWPRWLSGAFSESSSLFDERSPYCNSTFDQGEDPCNPPPYRFLDHVLQVHSQSDSQSWKQ
jgi:hypothetical protein